MGPGRATAAMIDGGEEVQRIVWERVYSELQVPK